MKFSIGINIKDLINTLARVGGKEESTEQRKLENNQRNNKERTSDWDQNREEEEDCNSLQDFFVPSFLFKLFWLFSAIYLFAFIVKSSWFSLF